MKEFKLLTKIFDEIRGGRRLQKLTRDPREKLTLKPVASPWPVFVGQDVFKKGGRN